MGRFNTQNPNNFLKSKLPYKMSILLPILFLFIFTNNFANSAQGKLRIRYNAREHGIVMVGDFEYDYLKSDPPRRRIVKSYLEEKAQPEYKGMPIKGEESRQFELEKADHIFIEMVTKEGWTKENYEYRREKMRTCRAFIYEFVCKLFDGNCPSQENWPPNFMDADRRTPLISVFNDRYQIIRQNFKAESSQRNCIVQQFVLNFSTVGTIPSESLPLVLQITSGKIEGPNFMDEAFTVQQFAVNQGENKFKVEFFAFLCSEKFHFRYLSIMDSKTFGHIAKLKKAI